MAAVRPLLLLLSLTLSLFTLSSSIPESEALLKLKKSFTSTEALASWVPGSSPCSARWVGVICFGGIITGLHLSDLGLSGTIDVQALQEIRGLRTLSFTNNTFSGSIPQFNKLGALKSLLLSSNKFSGEIPGDFFSRMTSLKKVWFANNDFSGKIPESLMQLPHLIELHLEGNRFTGSIPPIRQPTTVTSLDMSHNYLEGEVPESYSKFNATAFAENAKLCGKLVHKDCSQVMDKSPPPEASGANQPTQSGKIKWLIIGVIFAAVVFFVLFAIRSARRRDNDFSMLDKENYDEVVEVHVAESIRKPRESSRKGSSKKGSAHGRNGMGDLIMVNDEKGSFGLQDLMKAAAEVLGNGGLGSAYKAVMSNGLSVVVKRMREMNRLGRDGFDAEMRRFGRLRHRNILTPLAYHYRREEKLMVSEYVPKGSLLYVLHGDRGMYHAELNWATRLKIMKGIARGMGFLHSEFGAEDLPHGNLKSSNVLLDDDYEPLLNDYAFHSLVNPNNASQGMFAYKSPEYIQYQQVSQKSDVYCLGILILEILTGKFPSQYLSTGKGGTDVVQWVLSAIAERREAELIDPEIASEANSLGHMVQLLQIGTTCTECNPEQRPSMREAIRRIEEL